MSNGTEEKVLGPGAVLHDVDTTGELVEAPALGAIAEPAADEPVAPDVLPTPTPVAEPGEFQPVQPDEYQHAEEAQQ